MVKNFFLMPAPLKIIVAAAIFSPVFSFLQIVGQYYQGFDSARQMFMEVSVFFAIIPAFLSAIAALRKKTLSRVFIPTSLFFSFLPAIWLYENYVFEIFLFASILSLLAFFYLFLDRSVKVYFFGFCR